MPDDKSPVRFIPIDERAVRALERIALAVERLTPGTVTANSGNSPPTPPPPPQ